MEEEIILSGYCRCLDASRTVMVEDGEADCLYENCPHKASCNIAKEIAEKTKEK
jgi:hypothetical protein